MTKAKGSGTGKAKGAGKKSAKETAEVQGATVQETGKATAPVKECKHPEAQAVTLERADGSGKWDRVCGVEGCGFVMCEVGKPAAITIVGQADVEEEVLELAGGSLPHPDNGGSLEEAVTKAEADLGLVPAGDFCVLCKEANPGIICGECANRKDIPAGNLFEQVQAELAAEGASLDETTGEIVENSSALEGVDSSENQDVAGAVDENSVDGAELVQEVKADKLGKPFLKYLRVDVPDHCLAEMAKRQAELFNFWNETQVAKKKAAKAYKEDIDRTEDELTTIAEVIADGAEEQQISCRWEYDYRHGVKRLRRLDTNVICDEETLTAAECHLSFDFDPEEDKVQEEPAGDAPKCDGNHALPECDDPLCWHKWVRNDERTLSVLGLAGVTVDLDLLAQQSPADLQAAEDWALAVHVQASDNDDVQVPTLPSFLKSTDGVPVDAEFLVNAEFEECGAGLAEGPEVIGVDLATGPDLSAVMTMEAGKVVDITHTLDVNRRCCLPSDRATGVIGGVETIYCTVCGLVARKRKENADPWDDDLEFEIGEKVALA